MKNRGPIVISAAIVAAMLAASLWAFFHIAAGTQIPIHWNVYGTPDRFAEAPLALFMTPAMTALLVVLFAAIPAIEPRRLNLQRSTIIIGNCLGKTRSMFLGGVRTPWTLSSEYSWQRTHSLAGKLFIASGALGFVAVVTLPLNLAVEIFVVFILATVLLSIVLSYVYWLREPERRHTTQ